MYSGSADVGESGDRGYLQQREPVRRDDLQHATERIRTKALAGAPLIGSLGILRRRRQMLLLGGTSLYSATRWSPYLKKALAFECSAPERRFLEKQLAGLQPLTAASGAVPRR